MATDQMPPGEPPNNSAQLGIMPGDQVIHQGQRVDLVVRRLAGRNGAILEREVVLHPGAVIILPVLADGRIVMIRNQRHTIHDELWELPAGTLEKREDPALCAARELTEETGYTAQTINSLGWFYTSPGILTEKMYAFVATGLAEGPQHLEENEEIKVQLCSREQVQAMIRENLIVDAKTIATLLKYFLLQ